MKKTIAIIGGGVTGLTLSYALRDRHEVHLFEKTERLGGHARTIKIAEYNSLVDTGFIVLNDRNYPLFSQLLQELNVPLMKTEMSFSASIKGQEWGGSSLSTLFAQKSNLLNWNFLKGLGSIYKFNQRALSWVKDKEQATVDEMIKELGLNDWFKYHYLYPMASAIWSSDYAAIGNFPAYHLVQFFDNHGLLSIYKRPQWYTLTNKSENYVKAMIKAIASSVTLHLNANIKINTYQQALLIDTPKGGLKFDAVIFACHPEAITSIMGGNVDLEIYDTLSQFKRTRNLVVTHKDESVMPKAKACWSSWNYKIDAEGDITLTYWMNRLQGIDEKKPLFVTLNPKQAVDPSCVFDEHVFYHPLYDQYTLASLKKLDKLQGKHNLWFAGAWMHNGFHEDGVKSAFNITNRPEFQ